MFFLGSNYSLLSQFRVFLRILFYSASHTTAWTNTSKEMPDSITKIVDEIKKVVAKEKAV
jgi:hypothetical protein